MKESAGKQTVKSKAVQLDMTSPWQKYANLVMIPLIIGLSVFLLVRFRLNSAAQAKANDMGLLSEMQMRLADFRMMDFPRGVSLEELATNRDSKYVEIAKQIDQLLEGTKEPAIRAEALVARGDLNWQIANFPAMPGSTTRPTLATAKPIEDYLAAAETAYNEALKDYPDQLVSAATAKLGLAAIAENRGNFDAAAKAYQAIVDDSKTPAAFTMVAQMHLTEMKITRDAYFFGTVAEPSKPFMMMPTTLPTTAPAMRPTTQPAAAAATKSSH